MLENLSKYVSRNIYRVQIRLIPFVYSLIAFFTMRQKLFTRQILLKIWHHENICLSEMKKIYNLPYSTKNRANIRIWM